MRIVYYDESGDDGFPDYSSPLFILSAVYMKDSDWKDNYSNLVQFRKYLHSKYFLPIKFEIHAKNLLLDKNPYREINNFAGRRIEFFTEYIEFISNLKIQIINIVIIKDHITSKDYNILDKAVTFSVQRIENDILKSSNSMENYVIISDPGRVKQMRSTTRKIQRVNYIPSKYSLKPYRSEISLLIEDPLEKDSRDSHFIQIADSISYIINLYTTGIVLKKDFPNRLKNILTEKVLFSWMNSLTKILNLHASAFDTYGIVFQPKKSGPKTA